MLFHFSHMAKLLQTMKEQCEYLEKMMSILGDTDDTEEKKASLKKGERAILDAIAMTSLSQPDATSCMVLLGESKFPKEVRRTICTAIVQRVSGSTRTNQSRKARNISQSFLTCHRYLGQDHWDILMSTETSWVKKQQVFLDVFDDADCAHPSEYTFTHCVAISTLALNTEETLTISPGDAYQKACELKQNFCNLRKHKPSPNVILLVFCLCLALHKSNVLF